MHCWFETNFFVKLYRNKLKGFLQRILQEIKKNTWNIRHLVNETIIPETKRIILKIDGFIIHTCYQFSTKSMLHIWYFLSNRSVCLFFCVAAAAAATYPCQKRAGFRAHVTRCNLTFFHAATMHHNRTPTHMILCCVLQLVKCII